MTMFDLGHIFTTSNTVNSQNDKIKSELQTSYIKGVAKLSYVSS
jgi:hypothetical protein